MKTFVAFKDPGGRTYRRREILSLCPLNQKVTAVFFFEDEENLFRSPQLALAVYDEVTFSNFTDEETGRDKGYVGFIDSVDVGAEFADDHPNFLGYEYGETEGDWAGRIKYLKKSEEADRVVALIRSIPMRLDPRVNAGLLTDAQGRLDNGVLTIRSKRQRDIDELAKEPNMEGLQQTAEAVFGKPVTIRLEIAKGAPR